ncbi:MAG: RecX family transcriptional regulator [Saprospiraceae bacterium]|nr:RecX family transcriptional regulator [Saprospiraceae bacterium]
MNHSNPEKQALTPDEILSKMEQYCAYQERSPMEVQKRLATLGANETDATQILEVLKTDGFFDETRFAFAFARGKFRNNHWGKIRIRHELRLRNIHPEIGRAALEALDDEGYETTIIQLLEKKLEQYKKDQNRFQKAAAAVIRSGYESDLVFNYLNQLKQKFNRSES